MFKDGRKEWISPIEDLENDTVLNEEIPLSIVEFTCLDCGEKWIEII